MSIKILSVRECAKDEGEENCGYSCTVEGTKDGRPFKVNVWAEYDGREMDHKMISGEDITTDTDFMESLFSCDDFVNGYNNGYAKYEAGL